MDKKVLIASSVAVLIIVSGVLGLLPRGHNISMVSVARAETTSEFGNTYINQVELADNGGNYNWMYDNDGESESFDYQQEIYKVKVSARLDEWYASSKAEAENRVTIKVVVYDPEGVARYSNESWDEFIVNDQTDTDNEWWITVEDPSVVGSALWSFDSDGVWNINVSITVNE